MFCFVVQLEILNVYIYIVLYLYEHRDRRLFVWIKILSVKLDCFALGNHQENCSLLRLSKECLNTSRLFTLGLRNQRYAWGQFKSASHSL